jgi:hypothetical protein
MIKLVLLWALSLLSEKYNFALLDCCESRARLLQSCMTTRNICLYLSVKLIDSYFYLGSCFQKVQNIHANENVRVDFIIEFLIKITSMF